jgi:hypothetical protein
MSIVDDIGFEIIAVLYSFEQKCFHVETLHDYIKSNVHATIRRKDHQYRLIAIAKDYEDAHEICEQYKKLEQFKSALA